MLVVSVAAAVVDTASNLAVRIPVHTDCILVARSHTVGTVHSLAVRIGDSHCIVVVFILNKFCTK